jgi:hypothetical protein
VLGILSLVFWTLTVVVSLKYVTLILRADNHGEGGLIAMLALASQAVKDRPRAARAAAAGGHLRHRDLLRRRRHHAGGVGAVGGRRPGGGRAGAARASSCRCRWRCCTALFAAQRFGTAGGGALLRAGDAAVVRRCSRCSG